MPPKDYYISLKPEVSLTKLYSMEDYDQENRSPIAREATATLKQQKSSEQAPVQLVDFELAKYEKKTFDKIMFKFLKEINQKSLTS